MKIATLKLVESDSRLDRFHFLENGPRQGGLQKRPSCAAELLSLRLIAQVRKWDAAEKMQAARSTKFIKRGCRLVSLPHKTLAIAVRTHGSKRRWTKLGEWLSTRRSKP